MSKLEENGSTRLPDWPNKPVSDELERSSLIALLVALVDVSVRAALCLGRAGVDLLPLTSCSYWHETSSRIEDNGSTRLPDWCNEKFSGEQKRSSLTTLAVALIVVDLRDDFLFLSTLDVNLLALTFASYGIASKLVENGSTRLPDWCNNSVCDE